MSLYHSILSMCIACVITYIGYKAYVFLFYIYSQYIHHQQIIQQETWLVGTCKDQSKIDFVYELGDRCKDVILRNTMGPFWFSIHNINQKCQHELKRLFVQYIQKADHLVYFLTGCIWIFITFYMLSIYQQQKKKRLPYLKSCAL